MTESQPEREAVSWLTEVGCQRPPYSLHFVIGVMEPAPEEK